MSTIQLPMFTRRVFLNRTLQALGAVAVMPLASYATEAATGEAGSAAIPALKYLTAEQYLVLDAVGDTVIPHGGSFELGARDVELARRIDSYLSRQDPALAQGVRGALVFVEQQAPALAAKAAPFSHLSEDDRAAVFDAMLKAGGMPAGILLAMKYVCMSHFYTLESTWKYTGYDGPMLLEDAK
jgi:Gluconate 2-dehydrogenase subunit 3